MSLLTQELSDLAGQWIVRTSYPSLAQSVHPGLLVAANPLRWGLIIVPAGSNNASYFPDPNLPNTLGIGGQINAPSVSLSYRDWGGLVQAAWYGLNSAGPGSLTWSVIEVLLQQ